MDKRTERNLIGVDDSLIILFQHAYDLFGDEVTKLDKSSLICTDGLRTEHEQRNNVAAGRSWTMESKHLPDKRGVARALDFGILFNNRKTYVHEFAVYERVWIACFRPAAACLGMEINWGGHWKSKDGPHIELAD